jgi:hypothetical protein
MCMITSLFLIDMWVGETVVHANVFCYFQVDEKFDFKYSTNSPNGPMPSIVDAILRSLRD